MAATDTTKVPGVPTTHHNALCRMASVPFLIEKKLPQLNGVLMQVARDEQTIRKHYSRRGKDIKQTLLPFNENNK